MTMAGHLDYVKAFKRNCPAVRLSREEEEELTRLFLLARTEAREQGRADMAKETTP